MGSAVPDRVGPGVTAGLLVLALLPRLLYLLVGGQPFESPYWTLAGSLLKDGSLSIGGVRTTAFEPGYPMFLAMARALLGDRPLLVQAIQCLLAAGGALFLYRLATALTGRWRVGAIAALLYAAYPLLVRHSADRSDAALMTTLLIAFASSFVAAATPVRAATAGVWLGLAVLTRAMALPLVPLAVGLQWRNHGSRAGVALGLASLVVIAPYAARNYALNGSPLPTRGGLNLFISNCDYTASIMPDYGPDILEDYAQSVLDSYAPLDDAPSPVLERTQDLLWTSYAIREMRQHPVRTLGLKVKNVLYFFSPRLVPSHVPTDTTRIHLGENGQFAVEDSPIRPLLDRVVYGLSYTPVLVLALTGVWLRRHDLHRDAMLWCVVATFVAVHAVYFPTTRYRVPMEFVLLFYAAVALDRGWTDLTVEPS
jgi:hypothetical protein